MKDRIMRSCFVIGLLTVCILQFCLYSQATSELSNEMLAWGFRRGENHSQPTLDTKSEKVVREFDDISMGNETSNKIYLTFDCGYENGYTEAILDALKENDVKASFFITGHYLNTASDIVKRMIEEGHIVGNHTVNHKCLPNISDEEIKNEVEKQNREEYGKKKIVDNIHNGCVLLLHATSKDNSVILSDVIKEIKGMGYEFKNINEFER